MKSRNLILIIFFSSLLSVIITISFYYYKFGSTELSDKSQDWVNFTGYFNGIIGVVFTFLNLILLTYLSVKLVKIEDDRNAWTIQELARPYSSLIIDNNEHLIEISIHNLGLGPMIITDFTIKNSSGEKFDNFYDLIRHIDSTEKLKYATVIPKVDSFEISVETGAAVGKDQSHCVFRLHFKDNNILNKDYADFIRAELNDYTLSVSYNDIYNRSIDTMKEKLNIKPWDRIGSA